MFSECLVPSIWIHNDMELWIVSTYHAIKFVGLDYVLQGCDVKDEQSTVGFRATNYYLLKAIPDVRLEPLKNCVSVKPNWVCSQCNKKVMVDSVKYGRKI